MCNLPFLIRSVPSDGALEILANSMWSTMMITCVCFVSFLICFLSVRVGRSTSMETDPLELSFIFSLSGLRYLNNHVRHHLFETPLLPRRRFSSISTPWLPSFISRNFTTYKDLLVEQPTRNDTTVSSNQTARQKRSSSMPDHQNQNQNQYQTSRSSSTSTSFKGKRFSVSLLTNSNQNSRESYNYTRLDNNQSVSTAATTTTSSTSKNARRNTLPHIPLAPSVSPFITSDTDHLKHEAAITNNQDTDPIQPLQTSTNQTLFRKNTTPHLSMPVIDEGEEQEEEEFNDVIEQDTEQKEEEEQISLDNSELIDDLSDNITCGSETEPETEIDSINVTQHSEAISIPTSISTSSSVAASPKSSYKSSYFNYLPESIFGYSTANYLKLPMMTSSKITESENLSPPPGYGKRSLSRDFSATGVNVVSTAATNEVPEPFVPPHQPLYARRRTEIYRNSSSHFSRNTSSSSISNTHSSTGSSTLNASAPHFQPENIAESDILLPHQLAATIPKSVSPCLNDLNNTADLFAPINWSFTNSEQTEASRRSWSAIEAEEERQRRRSNVSSWF